jgi:DNA mismatch repair ATPase MutL
LQEIVNRLLSDTDINTFGFSLIGCTVRAYFTLFCFGPEEKMGTDVVTVLENVKEKGKEKEKEKEGQLKRSSSSNSNNSSNTNSNNNNNSSNNNNNNDNNNNNNDSNNNNNNKSSNEDNTNDNHNESEEDSLDFGVEASYNIILLSLQSMCNISDEFSTISVLLSRCPVVDIIATLRGRFLETKLRSVEIGILGEQKILK